MPGKNDRRAGMYKKTSAMVIAAAEWAASLTSKRDRARFDRFFAAIESFASENEMIVGGLAAIRLLLAAEAPSTGKAAEALDSYFYELYSAAPVDDARALTQKLYALDPDGLGHYAAMLTRVPGKELVISLAGRDLVVVRGLATHKGVRVLDLVLPSARPGQFVETGAPPRLLCFGPELSLMSVVAALCDPSRAAEWPPLLTTETKLRGFYLAEHRTRTTEFLKKLGGRGQNNEIVRNDKPAALKARLVLSLVVTLAGIDTRADAGEPRVLVGGFSKQSGQAGRLSSGAQGPGPGDQTAVTLLLGRIQLATPNKMAAEATAIQAIATRVFAEAGARGASVQTLVHNPAIPTEARLRRLTVYLQVGAAREPIADVFNAAEYGLVPFVPARVSLAAQGFAPARSPSTRSMQVRLGTPFVQMRFQLINIWTMRLQAKLGAAAPEFAENVTNAMLRAYQEAGRKLDQKLAAIAEAFAGGDPKADEGLAELFPATADRVIGFFEDEAIAKKRAAWAAAESSRSRHGPYYPARAARLAAENKSTEG